MKKTLMISAAVMLFLTMGALRLWAHDDATPDQTLTGEVVCLSCYLGHGAQGDVHAKCARDCFKKGLPVGLKVGDKLYLVVGEHHGTATKMLSSYAGKEVTVSGHVFEQEGMRMIEVEKVEMTKDKTEKTSATETKKEVWVCTMCDYKSDKPGKCKYCGMDLVKQDAAEEKPKAEKSK